MGYVEKGKKWMLVRAEIKKILADAAPGRAQLQSAQINRNS
jgi:hypothetical protein